MIIQTCWRLEDQRSSAVLEGSFQISLDFMTQARGSDHKDGGVLSGVNRQPVSALRKRRGQHRWGGGGEGGGEGRVTEYRRRASSCWLSDPDGGLRYFEVCDDSHWGEVLFWDGYRVPVGGCVFLWQQQFFVHKNAVWILKYSTKAAATPCCLDSLMSPVV